MAPMGEAYFPPLDRCFSGEHQLWSWEACYTSLTRAESPNDNPSLKRFLADPQTTEHLQRCLQPFTQTSAQSKSSFDTKTSAINVTQSSNARYDITQIQEDSLWLSKETKIDEVSALRVAVLEWQTRPAAHILATAAQEPTILEERPRRRRLAQLLLSERRHVLKCGEYVLSYALGAIHMQDVNTDAPSTRKSLRWLADIGLHLLSKWAPEVSSKSKQPDGSPRFLVDAITAIRSRLETLGSGSGWFCLSGEQDIEIVWGSTQVLEIIHIMQLMQDLLQSSSVIVDGGIIMPWFRLMGECGFLEAFRMPYPGLETMYNTSLQSLAGLVSLTLLNITAVLDVLDQTSTASLPTITPKDSLPFILNEQAVHELNDILINTASLSVASPTTLAWSIITQTLREIALATRDNREVRQSIRVADKYGAADSSDTDGLERPITRGFSSLRRRSSTGSDTSQQATLIEDLYDSICVTVVDDDPIAYLAMSATEAGKVFEVIITIATSHCSTYDSEAHILVKQKMRTCLLDLIRVSVDFVEYQPGLVMATLAVVTQSERYWDLVDEPTISGTDSTTLLLRQDPKLKQKIFLVALSRFPYESMPLLQICRALADQQNEDGTASEVWSSLQELDMFTCVLPTDFHGYKNIREDEETDFIELTHYYDFDLTSSFYRSKSGPKLLRSFGASSASGITRLPQGTQGQVLSNGKPLVVAWNYEYSGLTYIGRLLQCASDSHVPSHADNATISPAIIGEAIGFITTMVLFAVGKLTEKHESAHESASAILANASDGLDRDQDIISVIFQIFENELYRSLRPAENDSPDVSVQCIHFAHALLPIMPDRVWPFLGRSGLLGVGDDGGRMGAVVSSYEILVGRYDFLLGCLRLYDALIEDVIRNAVYRRTPSRAIARFGSVDHFGTGVSQPIMEKILLSFQRTAMDVFDSFKSWKFADQDDRAEMGMWLCIIFEKLLNYRLGTTHDLESSSDLTSALSPAADMVLDVFLSTIGTDLAIEPLLQSCSDGLTSVYSSILTRVEKRILGQSVAALGFISTLIEASDYLQRSSLHLQHHLFQNTKLFVKLYATHQDYKLPVIHLLCVLTRSATLKHGQPQSLLGHLGQGNANSFMQMLSTFDQPFDNDALVIETWGFLAAIVSNKQPWFAQLVLTGNTPRSMLRSNDSSQRSSKERVQPIFNIALDRLSDIDKLHQEKALAILEFVALASDFWPQIWITIHDHPRFLLAILNFASRLKLNGTTADFLALKMSSYVGDILALYTRWTTQEHGSRFAQEFLKHLDVLAEIALSVPTYNASLHGNLRHNFASKFPGCGLSDIQKTTLRRAPLGESYFYDIDVADKMLSFDPAWSGRKDKGFGDEVRRANFNLSAVETQVEMFHSWKSVLIELAIPLATDTKFQRIISQTIIRCLRANADNYLPEVYFTKLAQSRADLAFSLLESLVMNNGREGEVGAILNAAWNTLRNHHTDIGTALSAGDADYHRTLLRILYLALQVQIAYEKAPSTVKQAEAQSSSNQPHSWGMSAGASSVALTIVANTVAKGFRSLTNLLYDSPHLVLPSDFTILSALFRSCLQLRNVDRNSEHLVQAFFDTQTPRCASVLLSWSDQLATSSSGDPIYAEIAILFLLEISTVPALAENLAVEGVLSYILTANLIRLLQNRSFGPFDTPPRMYAIWSQGVLPLLLNILHAVGPPVAAEVAAALNTFPHQLKRAGQAFATPSAGASLAFDPTKDAITLSMAQEAHCLALIVSILRTFREAGASAAVVATEIEEVEWDATQVKDDIEGWLQRRSSLRDHIVPIHGREEVWSGLKLGKGGLGENKLEERVLIELSGVVGILGSPEA